VPRAFSTVATAIAAFVTLLAVAGLVLAGTSAPAYVGVFAILTGFGVLTMAAGVAAIRTGERTWGYLLTVGMLATTGLAFYAAAN
jgi:hypothetical protein